MAPPTTVGLTYVFPHTGETATSIATDGDYDVPKYPIEVKNVVRAYVYMDSIFYAADVQSQLATFGNRADQRTLHEEDMLRRQGELRKLRPCVVMRMDEDGDGEIHYFLCPMAGFHEAGGSRKRYKDLKAPTSLLVRPVETIDCNQTFEDYTGYQFIPKWRKGPQYLFPIEVSRHNIFVANHRLRQSMDQDSFERLREDIKKVSDVWKKWRKTEHVVVESDQDGKWLVPSNICVIKPLFRSRVQLRMGPARLDQRFSDAGEALYTRFVQFCSSKQAYPSGRNRRGDGAMVSNGVLWPATEISHSSTNDTGSKRVLNAHH